MTSPLPADRSGSRRGAEPGTERLPRIGAGVAEPDPDATGRLTPDGRRPGPPPVPPAQASQASQPVPPVPPVPPPPTADDGGPQPAGRPPGRAGRNLTAAIGVGLGLGAVILVSLFIWRPAFLVVLAAATLTAIVELSRALHAGKFRPPLIPVLVGAAAMIGMAWSRGATGLVIAFLFTVLAVVLWRLAEGPVGYLQDTATGVLVALYVPLLAGFAALLLVPDDGAARVLIFIATVVCNDVGGYAAGVLFGKHPMAPSVSPKKSWEGLGGSLVACMLLATLVLTFTFHRPWWTGLVFGAAIAASATIGDLGESLIKRDLGIKDMGHLLPGHGGIMDRLDSLLPSAAVAYLLLTVLAPA
jgi:phosphatidate cytidylyltransferase